MSTKVTLIPGDGIGPSITRSTVRLLDAAGAEISWEEHVAGMAAVAKYGDPIPDETLDSIKRTRVALKGPLETPVGEGYRSINVALRKSFDLYANVRPVSMISSTINTCRFSMLVARSIRIRTIPVDSVFVPP